MDPLRQAIYESVAERLAEEEGVTVTAEQLQAAIGQTRAGDPGDSFWAAWDFEVSRIADFFLSVKDEPTIKERINEAT